MKRVIIAILASLLYVNAHTQNKDVVISGLVKDKNEKFPLEFVNVVVYNLADNNFISGTITDNEGLFMINGISSGEYYIELSYVGYEQQKKLIIVGRLSNFLDIGTTFLSEISSDLEGVSIVGLRREVVSQMDKKIFTLDENFTQLGGSVLQAVQNLPGITVDQNGKLFLRGSDKITVLIDGKQTAITGMGSQAGLDNLPASAIESIEIINNPSARYDASGMAGIINIVFKKQQEYGWNGKAGITVGLGNLWIKRDNIEGIKKPYQHTPKINPSLSTNYRINDLNIFFMGDLLYHKQLMKYEFTNRYYDNGETLKQLFIENRTQPIYNLKFGIDWMPNKRNSLTFSSLFNYREYTDLGEIPYIDALTENRIRLWQYYENEINQTLFATITHKYSFIQPGHTLVSSFNYSFRRKDEAFNFTNQTPEITGTDTTMLVADENIFDLTIDYVRPLRSGRIEIGAKNRVRIFPNDIIFKPGVNSILDMGLSGNAEYREWLSAIYGNYVYELKKFELEAGLRLEYVKVDYLVDPNHSVYSSDGFNYIDPFPTLRASFILNDKSRLSLFYNRRVDRPEEKDLRVFPTYADPEILQMGNPTLTPQFTQSVEMGYRHSWQQGYFYTALYHRLSSNLLTKIITEIPGTNKLVSVNQNADKGQNNGLEWVFSQQFGNILKVTTNANVYINIINAFSITNAYPTNVMFSSEEQRVWTGNVKINLIFRMPWQTEFQITGFYLAPNIIPQGKVLERYSIDTAIKKETQKGKGELFISASDIFNTMIVRYNLDGSNFSLRSKDYLETQVIRFGYQYRF
jgi:outer membrane receptor protein involved in Fe transport